MSEYPDGCPPRIDCKLEAVATAKIPALDGRSRLVDSRDAEHDPAVRRFFAGILDVTEDGVITVDEEQNIVLFNHGAEKLFGWKKDEVIDRPLDLLIPAAAVGDHRGRVAEFAKSDVVSRSMGERRGVHGLCKNGKEFPADISISKMTLDGRLYLTAIVRDATDRHRHEEAIRQLNEELERRVTIRTGELRSKTEELRSTTQQLWQAAQLASVGELAASIAHELNNPLGIVSLRLEEVLAKTPPEDSRRKGLEIIEQEIERMATLVANLLQFSRPGHEECSSVNVADEINKTVELLQHHLLRRRIVVHPDFDSPSAPILASRQKLRQVFLNLISNAADAMPTGGTLTLVLRHTQLPGGEPGIRIEVVDTGHGIPPEVLPKVMDPFFTTKEEGKGTGLGLAICRRIVQEHHGMIALESAAGRGTTVRITLPATAGSNVSKLRESN